MRPLLLALLAAALVAAPAASAAAPGLPGAEPGPAQVCRAELTNVFSVYQCTLIVVSCFIASFVGGACVA